MDDNYVNDEKMRKEIETKLPGRRIHYYREISSTNTAALEFAEARAPEGTLVLADRQTGGHGRLNRKWLSPAGGGLWFTLVLRPQIDPEKAAQITLLAAVAIARAIEIHTGICPGIKWPNDLLIKGKKVCGIIAEMESGETIDHVILGIGINVNMDVQDFSLDLQDIATSLSQELGRPICRLSLLDEVLRQFDCWYSIWQRDGFEPIRVTWKQFNITLKQNVKVDSGDAVWSGEALDIDDGGALIIKSMNGMIKKFNFGEVSVR
ncbi:biotin--[acetyl-CoA-carboxylase] ligase [Pelosinus fermentans]|uniref:biotin--[biotin carboxyl-carrier protein] ligase n=1 Tax=Pelosinus fermentans JBW45 TaxID=1192197 RepID=I9NQV7_9FIRM|nr:biotin--[acetyl-CoA-carboxylase] ligase [Pelosinus fermentans]AJQ26740.1 biotin/acetyl-CoA-carboxylase ligase [Pelosinus fermentans JBW45]